MSAGGVSDSEPLSDPKTFLRYIPTVSCSYGGINPITIPEEERIVTPVCFAGTTGVLALPDKSPITNDSMHKVSSNTRYFHAYCYLKELESCVSCN